jgi:hypothetical protein
LPSNSGERRTLADVIFAKLDSTEGNATTTIQKVQQGSLALLMPVNYVAFSDFT